MVLHAMAVCYTRCYSEVMACLYLYICACTPWRIFHDFEGLNGRSNHTQLGLNAASPRGTGLQHEASIIIQQKVGGAW